MFDGHGREMGQIAAKVAKASMREEISKPEVQARLRIDPKGTLEAAFKTAHAAIEHAFRSQYEEQGWTVDRAQEGYLVRTRARSTVPMCIHGGTTATVVVLLDGVRLVVANVGDSTAIMAGVGEAGVLRPATEWTPMAVPTQNGAHASTTSGSASFLGVSGTGGGGGSNSGGPTPLALSCGTPESIALPAHVASSYMELSADHSPESASEYARMHAFRPHASAAHSPELLFVYDTLSSSKVACPAIFAVDGCSGAASKTERGAYYKNVRCEWATLVATPPHAPYQDALAFTRSLGDFHLQTYGVSHTPEIWWMDIASYGQAATGSSGGVGRSSTSGSDCGGVGMDLDATAAAAPPAPTTTGGRGSHRATPLVPYPLALVLASDGIWDNFKLEEVAGFVLQPALLAEVVRQDDAQVAANALMAANLERAAHNFGSSADNMTCIVMYFMPRVAAVAVATAQ